MPAPALRHETAPRRAWLLPATGAALLLAAGGWLLAPAAVGLLEGEPTPEPGAAASNVRVSAPETGSATPAPLTAPSLALSTTTPPPRPSSSGQPSSAATAGEPGDTGQVPPEQTWRPVAQGFAADFATPGPDWAHRLAAWTTPELADAYAGTEPTRQPFARLQDLEVSEEGPTSVDVLATYADTGAGHLAVELQVLLTPDGWRVSSTSRLG